MCVVQKEIASLIALIILVCPASRLTAENECVTELVEIKLSDGEIIKGKLYQPDSKADEKPKTLVIFVHGTGPGTYLTKRKSAGKFFNYFDYWGEEFCRRGVAFFSYNKRGVTNSDEHPFYDQVDREKFRQVVPSAEVEDLHCMIEQLKQKSSLGNANIVLLGGSEGTIVAAMTAEEYPSQVDALLLFGYAHECMYDIIVWQHSGASSMLNLNPVFDQDGDGVISQQEFESEDEKPAAFRKHALNGARFAALDLDRDEKLTAKDFAKQLTFRHNLLMLNFRKGNEDAIWNSYFRITIPWLKEHFELEPNKTRLTRLELPIFVFHGASDANVDVQGVYDLQRRFKEQGKNNLQAFVFEGHEHNLNFGQWVSSGEMSPGVEKIFEVTSALDKK